MIRYVSMWGCVVWAACMGAYAFAQPPLHVLEFTVSSNLAVGRAMHVAVDRLDGGLTATGAVRMIPAGGNAWEARVAVRGSVVTSAVQHAWVSRGTSAAAYCNPEDGEMSDPAPAATVPLWDPGYAGKTIHYVSTWTNVSIHYRLDGTDEWATSPPLERVGAGRTANEHRYRISGIGVAGRPLEFVLRGMVGTNELWDNAAWGGVGELGNNYLTWLDIFHLQDQQIFNYVPPAMVSPPQIISVSSWPSSYAGNGIAGRGGRVYLPRGYAQNTEKRYPVLYLHDGQNVFDPGGPFGSWSAEVAAGGEIAQGRMRETILVAVNNTAARNSEYGTPQDGHLGDYYVKYVVDDVKPAVDVAYRTLTNFMDTGVMGSSLGGLISAYAGLSTNVFGLIGAVSPSYWYGPNFRSWIQAHNTKGNRIYQDAGSAEGSSMWDHFWPVYGYYLQDGYVVGDDLHAVIGCGDEHDEPAWAGRVGGALRYLFPVWDEANALATSNLPVLAITNPPAQHVVHHGVAQIDLSGVAEGIDGDLRWTNALTGATGAFAATEAWTLPQVALAVGTNGIAVRHQLATVAPDMIVAEDTAGNYATWLSGHNEGDGFAPWILNADAAAGHFVDARGFGFWSHEGGNLSEAIRPLAVPLTEGQTFRVRMRNGWIWEAGGSVGLALRNGSGQTVWECYFNGGSTYYSITGHTTDVAWTDAGLDIAFTLTGASTYSVSIQPTGGSARQYSGAVVNGPVTEFRAWSYDNGTGDEFNAQRDFFVNDLAVTEPGPEDGVWIHAAVTVVREAAVDSNSDGVPDWWYDQHGFDPLVPELAAQIGTNGHLLGDSFLLGLNPNHVASTFKIDALGFVSESLQMTWGAMDDRRYVLQHAPSLGYAFTNLAAGPIDVPGNGDQRVSTQTVLESSAGTGFFRLRFDGWLEQ